MSSLASTYADLSDDEYLAKIDTMETKLNDYHKAQAQVKQQIFATVNDAVLLKLHNLHNAHVIWIALQRLYEGRNDIFINAVREKLTSIKCREGADLGEHFTTLDTLVLELAGMGASLSDSELTSIIIRSLPPSYDTVVTSLVTTTNVLGQTLKSIELRKAVEQAYESKKLKDEARSTGSGRQETALAVRTGAQQSKSTIECFNCHKTGHVKADCWQEGGGKAGQGPRSSGGKKRGNGRGGRGGKGGRGGGRGAAANAATADDADVHVFSITIHTDTSLIAHSTNGPQEIEIYDSGATRHISPYRHRFVEYAHLAKPIPIGAANGQKFLAIGEGTMNIEVPNGADRTTTITLSGVLHAPDLQFALISIARADQAGYTAIFGDSQCRILARQSRRTIGLIPYVNGLYQVRRSVTPPCSAMSAVAEMSVAELHRRMGHISPASAKYMVDKGIVRGIKLSDSVTSFDCAPCVQAKITRVPIPREREDKRTKSEGDIIHSDIWGPASVTSIGGNCYFATYTDDSQRWTELTPLKLKSDEEEALEGFVETFENQRGIRVKTIQSDRGGEYTSLRTKKYLRSKGITQRLTVHDTPEQNGVAERLNRTLVEHARAMLVESTLPRNLWTYAVLHATYLKNRSSTRALDGKTPYEARYGKAPDLRHLQPFGAKVWVRLEKYDKLGPKAREGRFVGYPKESKGIYVYWESTRTITVERNAVFLSGGPGGEATEDDLSEGAREQVEQIAQPAQKTTSNANTTGQNAHGPHAPPPVPTPPTPSIHPSPSDLFDPPLPAAEPGGLQCLGSSVGPLGPSCRIGARYRP